MTDFVLPPFVIGYGGWWIDVDLDGDLQAWAGQAARDVLARWGEHSRRRAAKLAAMLAEAGASARKAQGAILALLLYPVPGEGLRGGEQLAYLWAFPQYGAGMIMSITFQNLAEAGRWRDAVEELALAARLDETAGMPASQPT